MRSFTQREKTMLIVLLILVLGAAYYFFFFTPLQDRIATAEGRISTAQDQRMLEQIKLVKMSTMQREIEEMKTSGAQTIRALPPYNNLNMVMMELNNIMKASTSFDIRFPEIDATQRIVPRTVNITFTAANYSAAKQLIQRLSDCVYRCTVDSVEVLAEGGQGGDGSGDVRTQTVRATVTVTFYEKNANPVAQAETAPEAEQS